MKIEINPTKLSGLVQAPPSKSMAHRAMIAAALANGTSRIENIAFSDDMIATIGAVEHLGAKVIKGEDFVEITGNAGVFPVNNFTVDCIESGSTLRFLIPIASLSKAKVEFTGKGRLMYRPQDVYAKIFTTNNLYFNQTNEKITIEGSLKPDIYEIDGSISSQFITGLLFTLPLLNGNSQIKITEPFESRSYVDLTIEIMALFGVNITWLDANTLNIAGNQTFKSMNYRVEGDCSQAAFWAVLGAVQGNIAISDINPQTKQGDRAVFEVLKRAGADIFAVADKLYFKKSKLKGVEIDLADCPDLGPILMVLGLFCEGETTLINAGRLRVKESDRIAAMESEIKKIGGNIKVIDEVIYVNSGAKLHDADLISHNDHRIAMAMTIAGVLANIKLTIDEAEAINKSYPNFYQVVNTLGGSAKEVN